MNKIDKLQICKQTRKIASDTLAKVLKQVLENDKEVSETQFRDLWLEELRKHSEIFPDGWYEPPPNGMVVLFASKDNPKRADFISLRPEEYWPKKDIFLDKKEGDAYFFASPTNRQVGLAGDFSINIYFGKDPVIKSHLESSVKLDKQIFEFIKIGMTFSEVFQYADDSIKKLGLRNNIVSITDPGGLNIGHTIPFSYEDLSDNELKILKKAQQNWDGFKTMISKKRRFVSKREDLKVSPGMAFTIEPALKVISNEEIPMTMFHQIALIYENGEKELISGFDEIFKIAGMDYLLD